MIKEIESVGDRSKLTKELIEGINHELSIELIRDYFDNLEAKLHSAARYVQQELSHPNIKGPSLGQIEHFAIQQVTSDIFDCTDLEYNLRETDAKGAFFPLIELNEFALLPRRSVRRQEWQRAKYMCGLAQNNQKERLDFKQGDIFTPPTKLVVEDYGNNITDKILVILDILFLEKMYVKLIVPSSNLKEIHLVISLEDLINGIETISDDTELEVDPVSKLKKSLFDLDAKVQNE